MGEEKRWREPTSEIYYPGHWGTELDREKASVQNAAQLLARCPTRKALLESERSRRVCHGFRTLVEQREILQGVL